MATYDYVRALVGGDWTIRIPLLAQETKAALPGKVFRLWGRDVDVRFIFENALLPAEVVTLDATVAAHIAAGPYAPPPSLPRKSIRIASPNGTVYRLQVTDAGVLNIVAA